MDKVSTLTHILLELGYKDYILIDQAVGEFEDGLDSTFRDNTSSLWFVVVYVLNDNSHAVCSKGILPTLLYNLYVLNT